MNVKGSTRFSLPGGGKSQYSIVMKRSHHPEEKRTIYFITFLFPTKLLSIISIMSYQDNFISQVLVCNLMQISQAPKWV